MKGKRLLLFATLVLMLGGLAYSQMQQMVTVPELPFQADVNFFKLPTGIYFGDIPAVATNSHGHIFVASRSNISGPAFAPMAAQVFEFDETGKFIKEIGHGMYSFSYLHGIRVDRHDNIWVSDKVSNVVTEFHPDGTYAMVYGRRPESGDPPGQGPMNYKIGYTPPVESTLAGPADTATDSQDNLYVSDGYGNNRIAEWDKNGVWVRSFGLKGKADNLLNNPHNIAVDGQDRLWLADRGNNRLMVYDLKNNWSKVYEIRLSNIAYPRDLRPWFGEVPPYGATSGGAPGGVGAPWSVCITQNYVWIGDGFPARIYKLDMTGKVLGTYGHAGRQPGQFSWIHGLACPSDNLLYAADENAYRVQRLTSK